MPYPQLLGSYWTLAAGADPMGDQRCLHDFRKRVEIASKAGYTAMGFWHADIEETTKHYSLKEMKTILDANGITQVEVEWLLDWFCVDSRRITSDQTRTLLLDAAEALGARQIKIGDLGNDCAEIPKLTEEFAMLCDQAAKRGTNVLFELLPAPFSRAPTLELALKICREAGAKNGGLVLDVHHLHRTDTPPQDIVRTIPRDLPLAVELNDGTAARPRDLQDYVVNRRLFPGDGEFDLSGYLVALWTQGFSGPIGVEVINEYVRKWPLELAAEHSFEKTRRVVNAAYDQWLGGKGP
jgi:sugar phosphate isomerase/epimerase